jgi:PPOX class probable F420-dependent enzyme
VVELSPEVRRLFEEPNFVSLATVMEDGSPHVSPVWVALEDGRILVNTVVGRRKERNMRRDPRVALSLFDQQDPYSRVEIRGRVVEFVEGDVAERQIDELSKKYYGYEPYPDHSPESPRVIVKIEPEHVHTRL